MNKGTLSAAAAYGLWGFLPLYLHLLQHFPALQITAHRMVWSFILLIAIVGLRGELPGLRAAVTLRVTAVYLGAGLLLGINWLSYVYAVNNGFVVEASLGYFINPLMTLLLGVIFFRERLRPLQWVPVGLATLGVTYLTIVNGALPWLSLVVAGSFAFYALVKKLAPFGSLAGLTMETGVMLPLALGYLLATELAGTGVFLHTTPLYNVLLALTGVVTAVPLLLFATGARSIPMTTLGLLQYIAPTLQFSIGVFIFGEPFDLHRLIGFSIIWLALALFSMEGLRERHRLLHAFP